MLLKKEKLVINISEGLGLGGNKPCLASWSHVGQTRPRKKAVLCTELGLSDAV